MSGRSGASLSLNGMAISGVLLTFATPALLSAVSRQMQKEASDLVYSAKNTFFVPLGADVGEYGPLTPKSPQVKRLDIALDMRDAPMDNLGRLLYDKH